MDNLVDTLISSSTSYNCASDCLDQLKRHLHAINSCKDQDQDQYQFEEAHEWKVTARLMTYLDTSVCKLKHNGQQNNENVSADTQIITKNMCAAMIILQGYLLLHAPSKKLFSRTCYVETLTSMLKLPPNIVPDTTIECVIDTILCALIDAPANMRAFESCSGVGNVVSILRSKTHGRTLQNKCLEFIFFYLLPEPSSKQQQDSKHKHHQRSNPPLSTPTRSTPQRNHNPGRLSQSPTSSPLTKSSSSRPSTTLNDIKTKHPDPTKLRTMLDSWAPSTPTKSINRSTTGSNQPPFTPRFSTSSSSTLRPSRHDQSSLSLSYHQYRLPESRSHTDLSEYHRKLGSPLKSSSSSSASAKKQHRHSLLNPNDVFSNDPTPSQISPAPRRRSTLIHQIRQDDGDSNDNTEIANKHGSPRTPTSKSRKSVDFSNTDVIHPHTPPTLKAHHENLSPAFKSPSVLKHSSPSKTPEKASKSSNKGIRSVEQKKKILSKYLGNVDGLMERFQKMGLMVS